MINQSYVIDVSGIKFLRQGLILNNSYLNNVNRILFKNLASFYA